MCALAVHLVLSPMQVIFRRKKNKEGWQRPTTQTNKQPNTTELKDSKQTNSQNVWLAISVSSVISVNTWLSENVLYSK